MASPNACRFSWIKRTWCGMWPVMRSTRASSVVGPDSEWMPRRPNAAGGRLFKIRPAVPCESARSREALLRHLAASRPAAAGKFNRVAAEHRRVVFGDPRLIRSAKTISKSAKWHIASNVDDWPAIGRGQAARASSRRRLPNVCGPESTRRYSWTEILSFRVLAAPSRQIIGNPTSPAREPRSALADPVHAASASEASKYRTSLQSRTAICIIHYTSEESGCFRPSCKADEKERNPKGSLP